jgi:Domain of unknown function (DUF3846)
MSNELRVIVKNPEQEPEVRTIKNEIESLQEIVGGYIQAVPVVHGVLMLVNEEGLPENLSHNFVSPFGPIKGSALFVGTIGEDFVGLTEFQERQVIKYINVLTEWGEE